MQKVFCELLLYKGYIGAAEDALILATTFWEKPFNC